MPPPSAARASRAALEGGCVTPIAAAVLREAPADVVVVSQVQRHQPQRRFQTLDQRPMYAGFRLVLSRFLCITGAERRQGPTRSGIDLHRRRCARHPLQLLAQVRTSLNRVHTRPGTTGIARSACRSPTLRLTVRTAAIGAFRPLPNVPARVS